MLHLFARFHRWGVVCAFLIGLVSSPQAGTAVGSSFEHDQLITNIHQLHGINRDGQNMVISPLCFARLEGVVCWINSQSNQLVLKDDSGVALLNVNYSGQRVGLGTKIRLESLSVVRGKEFLLGRVPVVDNDGMHEMRERSGQVFLYAGIHPACLECFDAGSGSRLDVEWEGPGFSRRKIPAITLFRPQSDLKGAAQRINGLAFKYYRGQWERLPDFAALAAASGGIADNFDFDVDSKSLTGSVGVGGWDSAEFKDLKVTCGDKTLFRSDFTRVTVGYGERRLAGKGARGGSLGITRRDKLEQLHLFTQSAQIERGRGIQDSISGEGWTGLDVLEYCWMGQ